MNEDEMVYALAKQVVFDKDVTFYTDYGDVVFEADEAKPIIKAARKVLQQKLEKAK